MPKLWHDTIETHRQAVRDAALDTTASLVADHGLPAVTMSRVAQETGIGRATLYKYFPDVEAILVAWHERQIKQHLDALAHVRESAASAALGLEAVLEAYAMMAHHHHGHALAALLHGRKHALRAHEHLRGFVRDVISKAALEGEFRGDVAPEELASYALAALSAAESLRSKAAVRRLVALTLAGLRRPTT